MYIVSLCLSHILLIEYRVPSCSLVADCPSTVRSLAHLVWSVSLVLVAVLVPWSLIVLLLFVRLLI